MDDRPKRLADYFLVVGLGETAILSNESGTVDSIDLPYSTRNPITELAIAHKGDAVPDRFVTITETTTGQSANLNAGNILSTPIFLCYSREPQTVGKLPLPLLPICAISVYYPDRNQPIAEGHEILDKTMGGASADLNLFGRISTYLTFNRGLLYGHTPAITDLVIIGKDQSPPPGFKKLNMNLNKGLGPSLYICYKIAIVKPPSVSYRASVLSRYPKTNYEDFPLPESSPLFCLPLGVCVEHWESSAQFPLPTFSTFILTNAYGFKMYGSAVTFYEPIKRTHRSLPRMWEDLGTEDRAQLHMSKCICMLSRWPFFSAFKVFLSSLYRISLSPGTLLPIERYISNLMSDVLFPSISRPRVMMEIGTEQIVFTLPVQTPLPVSISNHWSLVNSLDADNCITLFSLLLMEQKVILHSSRPSLLTCVGEALTSVLFPFQWQCPYIPMCPLSLSVYTQAPLPFIIGIDSRYFDHYETPDDVCVIDLDCNTISMPDEIKKFVTDRPLPLKAMRILRKGLKAIASKLQCMMVDSDLAVELAPLDYDEVVSRNSLDQIDITVREVFLRFNATIFGHYPSCLSPMVANASDSARDAKSLFDQAKFLKMCPLVDHAFYKAVFNTQLFINFVEQRSFSYSTDTTLAFFDECTEKLSRDLHAKLIKPLAESQRQHDVTVVAAPPHGLGLEENKNYTYDGFPILDHKLFYNPTERPSSPDTDDAKSDSSSLITVRSTSEKLKGKKAAEVAHSNPELWAKTLLAEIYCLWFIHFPGFLKSDWNKMYHLTKAFSVLEEMHKIGAIPNDEVCYRVLMEQCVKLWKPFMAVKVFAEMQKVGINPNAVTYGIYNRALIDCNCPASVKSRWRAVVIVICTCLYLHRKVIPSDAQDGGNLKKVYARRNSYDEAIGESYSQATEKLLPSNKGKSSPKSLLDNIKARSPSMSKAPFSFGKDASKKKEKATRLSSKELQLEEKPEKDDGYRVKRGGDSQQNKTPPQFPSTGDYPDSYEKRHHTLSFNKGGSLKRPKSKIPPRMSIYPRRYDNIMPNSRSVSRMSAYIPSASSVSPDLNINISSCTECNNCRRLVYDEDIMSNWSALDSEYNTRCPYCDHPFVARLVVMLQQQQAQLTPERRQRTVTTIGRIPEEGSTPTPPARRKRNKPIKLPKTNRSSGETTPSDSPGSNRLEVPSSDSSPLLQSKVAKQEVASSSESSPLVNRTVDTKQVGSSEEHSPAAKQKSTGTSSEGGCPSKLAPQKLKPAGGSSPLIVKGEMSMSLVDEVLQQIDGKVTTSDYYSSNDLRCKEDTGPRLTMVALTDQDTPDASTEIAKMKARGHARAQSAPLILDNEEPAVSENKTSQLAVTSADISMKPSDSHKQEESQEKASKDSKGNKVASPIVVHYLGPLVLRKEVESLLIREGLSYLEQRDFSLLSPTVFWNLVWYFTRLGLTSYLPRKALVPFSDFIENKQPSLTINLLWDCTINAHDIPLYKLWKDKAAQALYPTDVAGPLRKKSLSQLQSVAAHLQCWDLLPVAAVILRDRKIEGPANMISPQRGLYHDLALFCSCLRQGTLDMDLFDLYYHEMLQQLPKHLHPLLRKEDEMPSTNSNMCRKFFNTLYVV